ncbi:MAG TPA: Ig-like domain-containing protein [Archangium sp.]|uniref:Ig-like domain-containing protein n=1 Tax=Archangium sp. TaxID=1872627 RepID=UPI002E32F881|nr:Ig-like domain-containing protein [Archangium sp.]HEX5752796.1 Ig-like domain-containing protein [Archangium sp.]
MALSKKQKRIYSPSIWETWMPSVGVVTLVGAHVLAASLGLYSSAPEVKVLQPATGASINGHLEIAVQADDGPTGSGVRSVEYQLGSTSGVWKPLTLDVESMTYKASTEAGAVPAGGHELYIRAVDYTGNLRTVFVTVKVDPAATEPGEEQRQKPVVDGTQDFSSTRTVEAQGWGGLLLSTLFRSR